MNMRLDFGMNNMNELSRRSLFKKLFGGALAGLVGSSLPVPKLKEVVERCYIGSPTPTVLNKTEWVMLDKAVMRASQSRLRAWANLSQAEGK